MKKILFLLFTLVSLNSFAQLYQTMPQYGYTMQRADIQQVLKVPSDTTTNKTGIVRRGTVLYVGNGTYWTPAGSVTDTSSLSDRINLKLNISDTSGMRAQLIAGSGIGLSGTYPNITVANTGLLTTPTWQETLTAGGNTVTTDNNNDLAGYDFTLVNGNYVALGGNEVFITDAKSSIHLYNNDLTLKPYTGNLKIDTLTNAPGTKAMRYNPSTGLVSYADTTAGGGGSGTVTSVATGLGLTGGTITTSGTVSLDTAATSVISRQRAAATYLPLSGGTMTGNINMGGTSLIGNTTSGGNLTLSSTSNATKGKLLFGTSAYDEVNNRLGIGLTTPSAILDVYSTNAGGDVLKFKNGNTADYMYLGIFNNSDKQLAMISYGDTQAGTILGNNRAGAAVILGFNNSSSLLMGTFEDKPVVFGVNNKETMRISSEALVIGSSTLPPTAYPLQTVKNANSLSLVSSVNTTSGTIAGSGFAAESQQNGSGVGVYLWWNSAGTTTSGMRIANTSQLTSTTSGGLNIGTNGAQQLGFWTNNTERARFLSTGELGIGTTTPSTSSVLDLTSTTKGFLPPRMTKTQRDAISSPATGLVIFQTDNTPGLRVYNGTNWMRFTETID